MRLPVSRKGFSLTEVALVLAVVGMVTGSIWTLMAASTQRNQVGTLYQQTMLLVKNVREYFSVRSIPTTGTEMTTTYTNDVLRAAGVFPEDMCPANCVNGTITTIYNAYGGTAVFALPDADFSDVTDGVPQTNEFTITYTRISGQGCIELGMKLSAQAIRSGLNGYRVGSNAWNTTFPISTATLSSQCSTAAAGNTLTLDYKLRSQ